MELFYVLVVAGVSPAWFMGGLKLFFLTLLFCFLAMFEF
jgi:hypothetical protein